MAVAVVLGTGWYSGLNYRIRFNHSSTDEINVYMYTVYMYIHIYIYTYICVCAKSLAVLR